MNFLEAGIVPYLIQNLEIFFAVGKRRAGLALAANLAMMQAKQLGRNRVCQFDGTLGSEPGVDPYQLYAFYRDGSLATIQAPAAAVDAKDPYTNGHSQRLLSMRRTWRPTWVWKRLTYPACRSRWRSRPSTKAPALSSIPSSRPGSSR